MLARNDNTPPCTPLNPPCWGAWSWHCGLGFIRTYRHRPCPSSCVPTLRGSGPAACLPHSPQRDLTPRASPRTDEGRLPAHPPLPLALQTSILMGMCATMEDNTSSIAPKTKIVFSKAILQKKSAKTKKSENKLFFFSAKNFKLESEKK